MQSIVLFVNLPIFVPQFLHDFPLIPSRSPICLTLFFSSKMYLLDASLWSIPKCLYALPSTLLDLWEIKISSLFKISTFLQFKTQTFFRAVDAKAYWVHLIVWKKNIIRAHLKFLFLAHPISNSDWYPRLNCYIVFHQNFRRFWLNLAISVSYLSAAY